MFNKDTFRLIRKTGNRFFSLVCIVFIGVAFMMGLMSTAQIMRASVDDYNDAQDLHDIQIYSSYGFCGEDIDAIRAADGVEAVYPSRMTDVYSQTGNRDVKVARIREIDSDTNRFELVRGRMPESKNEALALAGSCYGTGDKVRLFLEEGDLSDSLSRTEFTVTGEVKTGEYMSVFLSTSNLDSRDMDTVLYVDNSVFTSDIYTTVFVKAEDCEELVCFSPAYEEAVQIEKEELEFLAGDQQDYFKEKLLEDIRREIEDGERELEEKKAEGQKELEDARIELEDAKIQLILGEMQIEQNEAAARAGEEKFRASEKLLADSEKQLDEAVARVEEESGQSLDETYEQIRSAYYTYQTLKLMKENSSSVDPTRERLEQEIEDRTREIGELEKEKEVYAARLAEAQAALAAAAPEEREALEAEIEVLRQEIERCDNDIETAEAVIRIDRQILDNTGSSDETYRMLDEAMKTLDEAAGGSVEETYAQLTLLTDSVRQLEEGKAELEAGRAELEDGWRQLASARRELENGRARYEEGLAQYQEGLLTFDDEVEKAENEIRRAKQEIEDLPSAGWMVLSRNDSHYTSIMFKNTADQMQSIGYIMPLLFFLVAALVCLTTMTRLIDEQRGQIGLFIALGFSDLQITCKYLTYAFVASMTGAVAGIFVGMAMFPTVIYTTWRLMYDLPDMKVLFPADKLLISVFAFAVLMMAVTALVVRRSLRETPSQLMRPKAPKNAKKVFLENIKWLWNSLSFTSKITARNLIRYKGRFFMTVLGVAGCTSLLALGFGIRDSISDIIFIQFNDFFQYNYTVNLENDHEFDEIRSCLESDLDNIEVVPVMSYMTTVTAPEGDGTLTVNVVDPREADDIYGLVRPDTDDPVRLSNNGVIVTRKFAKTHGIREGDTISFTSAAGIHAEAEVTGIADMYFQHYLFITDNLYEQLFGEKVHCTSFAVRNETQPDALLSMPDRFETVTSVTNFDALKSSFNTMLEALDFIILVIIVTAGSLALVVLVNLTQVNISERVREIATLKVLGFNDREVDGYLFKEIFILSMIGGLCGLPLGKVELRFVMNVIDMEMITFPTNIKLPSYLISYAITLAFTLLVLLFTRKPLRKIEMVESLKSVE